MAVGGREGENYSDYALGKGFHIFRKEEGEEEAGQGEKSVHHSSGHFNDNKETKEAASLGT